MELIWNEIEAERLVKRMKVQMRVEGELPSPDGRTPKEIVGSKAAVVIESAAVDKGSVRIAGRVAVSLTAVDQDGKLFSYESYAGFEHSMEEESACPGMSAELSPCILELEAVPSVGGASLRADVDIDAVLTSSIPVKVTAGVSGVPDLEMKSGAMVNRRRVKLGGSVLRMREEIAAEGVSEIISAEGQIMVRDVTVEQGAAAVSGVITVSAVTVDKTGSPSQLVRQIPFRERVEINDLGKEPFCEAELNSVYMRALGEDFALISLETEASFEVYGITENESIIPMDAFSPSIAFGCLSETIDFLNSQGSVSMNTTIKETVSLPDTASDLSVPLFVFVRPVITEVFPAPDSIRLSGLLATAVTYESTSGRIVTFKEDVPFESALENRSGAGLPVVKASCVGQIVGTGERSVQIQYSLLINANLYGIDKRSVVTGLAECEKKSSPRGIMICFASEGEDVFDIAKRCCVSCETVKKLNPEQKPPFREGEKLLLLV